MNINKILECKAKIGEHKVPHTILMNKQWFYKNYISKILHDDTLENIFSPLFGISVVWDNKVETFKVVYENPLEVMNIMFEKAGRIERKDVVKK